MQAPSGSLEWLCTNRLGSFALGCADRRLRRKYHALLTVRDPGHGEAWNVLAELREQVTRGGRSSMLWDPLREQDAGAELVSFEALPHPTHVYRTPDGLHIERSVQLTSAHDQVQIHYRVRGVREPVELGLMPLLRCRPVHELTHENPFLDGSFTFEDGDARMVPYAGMPAVAFAVHGAPHRLVERGKWHRHLAYAWEAERGYPHVEDVFCPGTFSLRFDRDGDGILVVALGHTVAPAPLSHARPEDGTLAHKLQRAADQFVIQPRSGRPTVVAGYPWFGPYPRDTLVSLPGLHLASGDFERTAAVLEGVLASRVDGLIPRVTGPGVPGPSVCADNSLQFVRVVQWLGEHEGEGRIARFMPAVCELLEALADGNHARVRLDDGLGVWTERGPWALTWMDAMLGTEPVTPRAGYAVELDALAYNAAHFALDYAARHDANFARAFRHRVRDAEARFAQRFWNDRRAYLADAHDGTRPDASLRPNQLWALSLPHRPVTARMAEASLDAVTRELLTPAGLRTLSPMDGRFHGHFAGDGSQRDAAYHQGTVFPWLLGVYADAVLATRGRDALESALAPCLEFFVHHLEHEGCIGQVAELFDGDAPHAPGGSPAQAFSVAELYRAQRLLTARSQPSPRTPGKKAQVSKKDMTEKLQ